VGQDGTPYRTAGVAVREQVKAAAQTGSSGGVDPGQELQGYTVVKSGQTITMTLTLADGSPETHVLTLDSTDKPTSITVNGKAISGEWSGF
jgi:hypothetical protein